MTFLRGFLSNRPSRRHLKESGILRERVFGCDLAEHLQNTGQDGKSGPLCNAWCNNRIQKLGRGLYTKIFIMHFYAQNAVAGLYEGRNGR